MKRIIILVFLPLIVTAIFSQQGSPLLTNFVESREIENQSWAICQDENNVMLFANRKGILTFDGQDWETVSMPVVPYAMQKNPTDAKIYVGGDNNYGFLEKDPSGKYRYVSLSGDSSETGTITRIVFSDSLAWFYSDRSISRYNLANNTLELRLRTQYGKPYTGIFITPKNTFINVYGSGLYRLESDTLFPIVTGYLTEYTDILFSLPYNNTMVLVGLSNGSLSLFDGIKYYNYTVKDEGYLKDNILSDGIMLDDSAYAFSTLDGGALVIEKKGGKVLFTINNQNALPDDEVFAIGLDNGGGLWLSHQYGLTRADLTLPVSNFSIFPGLKGNLTSVLKYNKELYVATSEGIFYLGEVRNYSEVEVFVKSEAKAPEQSSPATTAPQEKKSGKKNLLSRIFGKKTIQQEPATPVTVAPQIPVQQVTRKTVSRLKSINFIYRKVEGFNEKCRQLVSTPYGILAATNRGLFVINNHKASPVVSNRYINFISWTPSGDKYYAGANDGYFNISYRNGKWQTEVPDPDFFNPVFSGFRQEQTLWLGGDNTVYKTEITEETGETGERIYKTLSVENEYPQRYAIDLINDSVFLFMESGVYNFNNATGKFDPYFNIPGKTSIKNFDFPLANHPLIKINDEWKCLESTAGLKDNELSLLKLFDDVVSVTEEEDNLWIIDGNNRLYAIDRKRSSSIEPLINILIKNISNDKGISFSLADVKFQRGDDVIVFDIIAPGYLKQNTTQYQYFINKAMNNWSPWSVRTHYEKTITRPGDYVLQVRAKDLWGNIGEPQSVNLTIKAPFTQTVLFYMLTGLAALGIIILVVRFREKQLHEENRILEEKVRERTAQIEAQKEEITASIEYASRIQMAMLPAEDLFKKIFMDYFIFFKPRDIVSGDFYWIGENDKSIFFTVADCTGHGVPGAFMSTLGISTLNEIIANNRNLQANKILNMLRVKIMGSLHQTGKVGEAADGMDIAFCVLEKDRQKLQFSGAYNPLFIIQDGQLSEYKANRMPIGIYYGEENSFTNNQIKVSKGDTVYIFSDGFIDQFGGPEKTKYKKSNLKKLLTDIYKLPMAEQWSILESELAKWKGDSSQIDDITILGVRI
jgi:serine phosphatase RsbU (regulator of sigma subunit)